MDLAPKPPQDLTFTKNSSVSSSPFAKQPQSIPSPIMETDLVLSSSVTHFQTTDLALISTGSPSIVEKPQNISMPSTPTIANISSLSPTVAQFHTADPAPNSTVSIAEQTQGISLTSLGINYISSSTAAQHQTAKMAAISAGSSPAIIEKYISISTMTNNSDSSPTMAQHGASELPALSVIPLKFDSFHSFRKLPIELRIKIWKELIPKSQRVVNLIYDDEQDRYFSFNSKSPVILYVSQESRSVGLKVYSICFGTSSYPAHIPFDFERDILYFDDYLANSLVSERLRRGNIRYTRYNLTAVGPNLGDDYCRVQKVAVNECILLANDPKNLTSGPGGALFPFLAFKKIQSLFVVVEVVNPYFRGEIFLCELQSVEESMKYSGSLQLMNASGVGAAKVVRALREGDIHIADSSQSAESMALELRSEVEKHGMPVSRKISGQMEPYFLVHSDRLAEEDEELSIGDEMSENDCLISMEEVQGLADEAEDHRQMLQSSWVLETSGSEAHRC